MCGICGICIEPDCAPVSSELLHAMMNAMEHRGPDGKGFHVDDAIGLGHRRLSIIDLETGDQPMYNEDGTIVIVFNGEIYNYKELRSDLLQRGHHFSTESDTEVIVHLYEDLGDACIDPLNGMFAFALWDARNGRLLAARYRFGEKPLYYCENNGRLHFASELKAILRNPAIPRNMNLEALDDYLAYGYIPAPHTIFKNIFKLRPGHRLVWEKGRVSTNCYWSVTLHSQSGRDEHEYLEEMHSLLEDSIRLRLRSNVPVGVFLSGDLDSS